MKQKNLENAKLALLKCFQQREGSFWEARLSTGSTAIVFRENFSVCINCYLTPNLCTKSSMFVRKARRLGFITTEEPISIGLQQQNTHLFQAVIHGDLDTLAVKTSRLLDILGIEYPLRLFRVQTR